MDDLDAIKAFLGIVPEDDEGRSLCADGKGQRGTGHQYGTAQAVRDLRALPVFDASSYLCLAPRDIDCDTHKILGAMDLRERVVSFDALHTQKETVEVIWGQGGDYIGSLEDQPRLLEDARTAFSAEGCRSIEKRGDLYHAQTKETHDHIETRRYYMAPAASGAALQEGWAGLRYFVMLEKTVEDLVTREKACETRYYITSLTDLDLAVDAIRAHWDSENELHWRLDCSFLEEDDTTVDPKAL